MVDLEVMAYFKLSLSTRNWDSAFLMPASKRRHCRFTVRFPSALMGPSG